MINTLSGVSFLKFLPEAATCRQSPPKINEEFIEVEILSLWLCSLVILRGSNAVLSHPGSMNQLQLYLMRHNKKFKTENEAKCGKQNQIKWKNSLL